MQNAKRKVQNEMQISHFERSEESTLKQILRQNLRMTVVVGWVKPNKNLKF